MDALREQAQLLERQEMANGWSIPDRLEKEVRERDKVCVYCAMPFSSIKVCRKSSASWEHVVNDITIVTRENIVLCCYGCNASKGQKRVSVWLQSRYCKECGIGEDTIAPVIKRAIAEGQ